MPRIIKLEMEVTDVEFESFLTRLGQRSEIVDGGDEDAGPVNTSAPALDSAGVPWIDGVHATTKATNADGTWRLRKGVDKAHAEAKIAEAKAASGQPAVTPVYNAPVAEVAAAPVAEVAAAPVAEVAAAPVAEVAAAPVGLPTGLPTGLPAMPPLANPVAPPAPAPVSYDDILHKAQELMVNGIPGEAFAGLYAKAGVTDTSLLATDETLRRALMDVFEAA